MCLAAIAPFEVFYWSRGSSSSSLRKHALHLAYQIVALDRLRIRGYTFRVQNLECLILLGHHFALAEGMGVPHQDLLLCVQSNLVELDDIVAADASARLTTVPVVGEALTVELKTL